MGIVNAEGRPEVGRGEVWVLLALVGLAQEGEEIGLDAVDERRKREWFLSGSRPSMTDLFYRQIFPLQIWGLSMLRNRRPRNSHRLHSSLLLLLVLLPPLLVLLLLLPPLLLLLLLPPPSPLLHLQLPRLRQRRLNRRLTIKNPLAPWTRIHGVAPNSIKTITTPKSTVHPHIPPRTELPVHSQPPGGKPPPATTKARCPVTTAAALPRQEAGAHPTTPFATRVSAGTASPPAEASAIPRQARALEATGTIPQASDTPSASIAASSAPPPHPTKSSPSPRSRKRKA